VERVSIEKITNDFDSAWSAIAGGCSREDLREHCETIRAAFEAAGVLHEPQTLAEQFPHYYRTLPTRTVDIYRMLDAFGVADNAVAHAIKKLFAAGCRGAKDKRKDLEEARNSITRQLEMMDEDDAALAEVNRQIAELERFTLGEREAPYIYVERVEMAKAQPAKRCTCPQFRAGLCMYPHCEKRAEKANEDECRRCEGAGSVGGEAIGFCRPTDVERCPDCDGTGTPPNA
jgi:hypothetical protein